MAGDWLKFESNLPEKPEVLAITSALGGEDPDLTVGRLMRLFRWFDQHTVDGNARGVTCAMLDRVLGVTGLSEAVAKTGWLVVSSEGLTLQKFEKHNGASAKSRAQTAKRVANHRGNARDNADVSANDETGNGASVTTALAREEKRREEKEIPPKPPKGGALEIPDWIPAQPWADFVAMRKAKGSRSPFTVGAARGILSRLEQMRAGGIDVAEVLNQSVRNGWADVFPPKARDTSGRTAAGVAL